MMDTSKGLLSALALSLIAPISFARDFHCPSPGKMELTYSEETQQWSAPFDAPLPGMPVLFGKTRYILESTSPTGEKWISEQSHDSPLSFNPTFMKAYYVRESDFIGYNCLYKDSGLENIKIALQFYETWIPNSGNSSVPVLHTGSGWQFKTGLNAYACTDNIKTCSFHAPPLTIRYTDHHKRATSVMISGLAFVNGTHTNISFTPEEQTSFFLSDPEILIAPEKAQLTMTVAGSTVSVIDLLESEGHVATYGQRCQISSEEITQCDCSETALTQFINYGDRVFIDIVRRFDTPDAPLQPPSCTIYNIPLTQTFTPPNPRENSGEL